MDTDYSRMKPTGMTAVVDDGGAIPADNGWAMPSEGVRNPQPQYEVFPPGSTDTSGNDISGTIDYSKPLVTNPSGNNLSRTETGPVLLEAMHLFLNQNNRIDWGRANYGPGENGGIVGITAYQTTRAEEDPRNGTIDPWEPGIPRVQVTLYQYNTTVPLPEETLNTVADPLSTRLLINALAREHPRDGFRDAVAEGLRR